MQGVGVPHVRRSDSTIYSEGRSGSLYFLFQNFHFYKNWRQTPHGLDVGRPLLARFFPSLVVDTFLPGCVIFVIFGFLGGIFIPSSFFRPVFFLHEFIPSCTELASCFDKRKKLTLLLVFFCVFFLFSSCL